MSNVGTTTGRSDGRAASDRPRLVPRLMAIQIFVGAITSFLTVAFAPRLLLLEDAVVRGSRVTIVWGSIALVAIVIAATLVVCAPVRPLLRQLAKGESVDPAMVLRLYSIPARIVTIDLLGCLAVTGLTLIPPLRPETNDLYTQAELVLLALTMVSVAALPCYVMARAAVARVLELVPVTDARDALELLEARHIRFSASPVDSKRLQRRLFAAVATPVAFVALGASLLVHAHVRAFEAQSREADAIGLARGVLEVVNGDVTGRAQALEEAQRFGLFADTGPESATLLLARGDDGDSRLTVPLSDGHATIRFDTVRLSPATSVYILLALVATALAGLLGTRLGAAFASDVALARREVRVMGAADIIRGTRIFGGARFAAVNALLLAIDGLGAIFREFAAAQQRAIDARSATERMRGLFLASMSHDLKAPLNAILGFAELVSRGPLSEGQRESVAIIEQRGRELLYLINTILDAARVEANELVIGPEWTKVGDIVMPAVMDARELVVSADVQIVGEIQPGVPRIFVDPPRITQALTAVVLVASRSAEHGVIRVRATLPAAGEQLRIDVEATGGAGGVAIAERDRIFEAFKFADRARRHGSLGLGPSLARSIIELHGGKIDVEATQVGGMVFHVWIPVERMSTKGVSLAPPRPRP